jgi:hypothetical protein
MHSMLAVVQWQEMVEPAYLEQTVWKARFGVRDRRKEGPVNGVELWLRPMVNSAKVLDLGAILGIAA